MAFAASDYTANHGEMEIADHLTVELKLDGTTLTTIRNSCIMQLSPPKAQIECCNCPYNWLSPGKRVDNDRLTRSE